MELHISLVERRNIAAELYRQLRQAIVDGRLLPGEALPPSRELARRLRLSRTTVTTAYTRLTAEGMLTGRVGAGTFVSPRASDTAPGARPGRRAGDRHTALRARAVWDAVPLATPYATQAEFDFRSGLPDAAHFPHERWRRLLARATGADAVIGGFYGAPAGLPALREAIARHIGVARAVAATGDDVVVTSGMQQALDLVARVLVAPGETVAMEDPGYGPARRLFTSLGLRVHGVPVDEEGIVVREIPHRARIVYVTPSHQYPLGTVLSLSRRRELLAWALEHGAAIVEDDYDSEFRFDGRPIEPLQTMDAAGHVIYVGTFSKTLLPTLRLGFLVAPPGIREAIHRAKFVTDWHTSLLAQATLAEFIATGMLARHIRRMQRIYGERRELIRTTVARDFPGRLTIVPSSAGLHVAAVADRATAAEMTVVAERALAAGVAVQELSRFHVDVPGRPGLLLGYGGIATERIAPGLARLREVFDEHLPQAGRATPCE